MAVKTAIGAPHSHSVKLFSFFYARRILGRVLLAIFGETYGYTIIFL